MRRLERRWSLVGFVIWITDRQLGFSFYICKKKNYPKMHKIFKLEDNFQFGLSLVCVTSVFEIRVFESSSLIPYSQFRNPLRQWFSIPSDVFFVLLNLFTLKLYNAKTYPPSTTSLSQKKLRKRVHGSPKIKFIIKGKRILVLLSNIRILRHWSQSWSDFNVSMFCALIIAAQVVY